MSSSSSSSSSSGGGGDTPASLRIPAPSLSDASLSSSTGGEFNGWLSSSSSFKVTLSRH